MDKINIKDKAVLAYVEELEAKLKKFEESPYCSSYLSLLFQIECWNDQLVKNPIDLFSDKDQKEFDRAHKFFTEQKPYFEQLEYLRKLMNPDEQEAVSSESKARVKKQRLGTAEKMALNALK